MTIKKSTVFYIILLIVYLAPSRISNAFLPYSAYVFYILQLLFGAYYINRYRMRIKSKTGVWFLLFLLSGFWGMFITTNADLLSYIRYICWVVSSFGLYNFFVSCDEQDSYNFLQISRYMFVFTVAISWFYTLFFTDTTVYFWGSEAVTTHSMIMFLTLSIYYDRKYEDKLSVLSIVCGILSFAFCVFNNSGQGMTMIFVFCGLLLVNYFTKQKMQIFMRPIVVVVVIAVLYYIVITFRFTKIDIIVNYITTVLSKDVSLTGRDQIFSEVLEIFAEHPIFGYGYNNTIINDTLGKVVMQFNTAHNSVLQMLIDYGIFGTGCLFVFTFSVFKELIVQKEKYYVVIYFSIIAMFVGGLVNLIIPTNYYLMVVLLAIGDLKRSNVKAVPDLND